MSPGEDEGYVLQRHAPSRPVVQLKNRVKIWPLVPRLRERLPRRPLTGYQRGKRRISATLSKMMRVGPSRAAFLVDRLENEGAIVYERPRPGTRKRWRFGSRTGRKRE